MGRQNQGAQQPQHVKRKSKQPGQYNNSRQSGFSKPPFPNPPYYQQSQGFPGYGNYYGNSFANQSTRQYPSYQQAQQNPQSSTLPAPRQPLQITGGSNLPNPSLNQQNPRAGGNNGFGRPARNAGPYQGRPLRQQGTAYQASEDTPTHSDLESEQSPEETQSDIENYFANEDLDYYQPREEDEIKGHFVGTESAWKNATTGAPPYCSGDEFPAAE